MYRRRRIVAGIIALLLIAALVAGVIAITSMFGARTTEAGGQSNGQQANQQSAHQGPQPEADAATGGSAEAESGAETGTDDSSCVEDIVVDASTDKSVYTPDENPVLTMTVSNEGGGDCMVNLGTSEMEFLITSGNDRIFSSKDCQVDAADNYQSLEPGQTEKANFVWKRERTAPGCDDVNANPRPGTYNLVIKLGPHTSGEAILKLN